MNRHPANVTRHVDAGPNTQISGSSAARFVHKTARLAELAGLEDLATYIAQGEGQLDPIGGRAPLAISTVEEWRGYRLSIPDFRFFSAAFRRNAAAFSRPKISISSSGVA